jgi:uncharacterized membrane protein
MKHGVLGGIAQCTYALLLLTLGLALLIGGARLIWLGGTPGWMLHRAGRLDHRLCLAHRSERRIAQ